MSTIPQSTTPRTDAAVRLTIGAGFNMVCPSFARELETELAAEREQVRVLREVLELITNQADACKAFCDTFTPASRIKARAALEATEEDSK